MTDLLKAKLSRRAVLQTAAVGAIGIDPALRSMVYAGGSEAPKLARHQHSRNDSEPVVVGADAELIQAADFYCPIAGLRNPIADNSLRHSQVGH